MTRKKKVVEVPPPPKVEVDLELRRVEKICGKCHQTFNAEPIYPEWCAECFSGEFKRIREARAALSKEARRHGAV